MLNKIKLKKSIKNKKHLLIKFYLGSIKQYCQVVGKEDTIFSIFLANEHQIVLPSNR